MIEFTSQFLLTIAIILYVISINTYNAYCMKTIRDKISNTEEFLVEVSSFTFAIGTLILLIRLIILTYK